MTFTRSLVTAAAALSMAACAGPVSCKPCAGAQVFFLAPDGSRQPAPGEVELCIEHEPCQVLAATATEGSIGIPWDREIRELAGRRITVSVRPPDGAALRRGETTVDYHPGGGGPCSCDSAEARLTLS